MKATEIINKLQEIVNEYGDVDVVRWDSGTLSHAIIDMVYYNDESEFEEKYADDEDYIKDFNTTLHNAIIL